MTRRATRFVVHLLGTLVGIVVILLAVATWRLSQGPIVLGNVTPYLEAALNREDSQFQLGIDQAVLSWGDWQHALEIRAYGVRGTESDGGVAFSAKEVVMDLAMPPLLQGEFRPLEVAVINPWIRIVRTADGVVSLDVGADPPDPSTIDGEERLRRAALEGSQIMQVIMAAGETIPALQDLERFTVVDADLWIDDQYLDAVWNAPKANLVLTRPADGINLDVTMLMRLDGVDVPVDATAVYDQTSRIVDANVSFGRVSIARVLDVLPVELEADGITAPVSGRLALQLDGDLALLGGNFSLEAGAGEIDLPAYFEAPFGFQFAVARGSLGRSLSGIDVSEFRVETEHTLVNGHTALDGFGANDNFSLELAVVELPIDALPKLWPLAAGSTARDWVKQNMSGGIIEQATLSIASTLGELTQGNVPLAGFSIEGNVTGTSVSFIPDMPAIDGVNGRLLLADNRMRAETESGSLLGLAIDSGLFVIEPLDGDSALTINMVFDGPLQDALELAANPRLGFSEELGLGAEEVSGGATGQLDVTLAKLVDVSSNDVSFNISGQLSDAGLASGIRGYAVERGRGTITVNNEGLDLEADVSLDGVPFHVALDQNFSPDAGAHRTLSLDARLSQAELDGLDLPSMVTIEGSVDLTVGMVESWQDGVTWDVDIDMAPAHVVFPMLGLDKPVGDSASVNFSLIDVGHRTIDLSKARFDAGDVTVAGSGELWPDTLELRLLVFEQLAFGRSNLAGSVTVNEDNSFSVDVAGGELDLKPYMEDLTSASGPELPTFRLDGRVDRVWMTDDDSLTSVEIAALYKGEVWEELDLTGNMAGGSPMTIDIWRHDEFERRFAFSAGDAGDAMRLLDLFDDASGGTVDLRARIDDSQEDHPAIGAIRMSEVTMTNAPILARVLSLASLTSIANVISGEGLVFNSALVPFTKNGDQVLIENARAFGPGIGITVEGDIDLATDVLDLEGTIVPAYVVNSVLGEIPLLGDILTGGDEGGGIFAVAYSVRGPRDNPDVNVEPLSVLAPGYLRDLFTSASDDEVGDYSFGEASRDR